MPPPYSIFREREDEEPVTNFIWPFYDTILIHMVAMLPSACNVAISGPV